MDKSGITRESFKYNFLKHIILRMDFQGVLQSEMEGILINAKKYLKEECFNRYEKKINNEIDIQFHEGIFQDGFPVKEIRNIPIDSFINENNGYTIDLSTEFVCMKINAVKYASFEDYAKIFINIVKMYQDSIDFFTVKRFGLRKINFCFAKDKQSIEKYFSQKYYNKFDLFEETEIIASEKRDNFKVGSYSVNLLCGTEQGKVNTDIIYKVTLDSDIYTEDREKIEELISIDRKINQLNDYLFSIYIDALTDEFGAILLDGEHELPNDIIGVDRNE